MLVFKYIKIFFCYNKIEKAKYVLEVLEFITEKEGDNSWLTQGGKIKHIGYMKGKFKTKKDAVSYYDRHNPHMRSLNAHNTYISDWDPNTKLLYIVRDDYFINATIDCFSIDDNYDINSTEGFISIECKWLK
tara:strand:- start:81 stop:476 length:396 start_codon:yes stop_codon:yes gene_type:complete